MIKGFFNKIKGNRKGDIGSGRVSWKLRATVINEEEGPERELSDEIPIQYQERKTKFMGIEIITDPRGLIPRPETELLVKVVADLCRKNRLKRPSILDMGTGSGNISLGLTKLLRKPSILAVDVSLDALDLARENIKQFKKEKEINLFASDMFSNLNGEHEEAFDVIVSNPPYVSKKDYAKLDAWVRAEPRVALFGGEDGMNHIKILAKESKRYLKDGGFLAIEIGYDQSGKVKEVFAEHGFGDIVSFKDFNDYERVIVGWKNG